MTYYSVCEFVLKVVGLATIIYYARDIVAAAWSITQSVRDLARWTLGLVWKPARRLRRKDLEAHFRDVAQMRKLVIAVIRGNPEGVYGGRVHTFSLAEHQALRAYYEWEKRHRDRVLKAAGLIPLMMLREEAKMLGKQLANIKLGENVTERVLLNSIDVVVNFTLVDKTADEIGLLQEIEQALEGVDRLLHPEGSVDFSLPLELDWLHEHTPPLAPGDERI